MSKHSCVCTKFAPASALATRLTGAHPGGGANTVAVAPMKKSCNSATSSERRNPCANAISSLASVSKTLRTLGFM